MIIHDLSSITNVTEKIWMLSIVTIANLNWKTDKFDINIEVKIVLLTLVFKHPLKL